MLTLKFLGICVIANAGRRYPSKNAPSRTSSSVRPDEWQSCLAVLAKEIGREQTIVGISRARGLWSCWLEGMVIYIKKKRLSMKIAASRVLLGDRRWTWSGRCVIWWNRLPPEVRYGTSYLTPDFVKFWMSCKFYRRCYMAVTRQVLCVLSSWRIWKI